jgi:ABC-type polysaccharide/polyol phosphate transport system ATPase subunit
MSTSLPNVFEPLPPSQAAHEPGSTDRAVISVRDVSKRFRLWSERPDSLKTVLVDLLRGKARIGKRTSFEALREVSFDIGPGEFVGIMGRNGAGKSTLLKLIAGIYTPTSGKIEVRKQLAPLIELGAGFHPDLSGHENIFLNAAILGYGRKATLEALPRILDFAELGEHIWMPVKNYSSGMLVRLGFSIAAQLTAPIVLIDEVLAVGDAGFQKKCLARIHELHSEGRTIVLVTHDAGAVQAHCKRCIVIDQHAKVFDGPADQGVALYRKLVGG